MLNVMIDFETLSTAPNAAVISVGLVLFTNTEVLSKYYANIKPHKDLHQCPKTKAWWAEQSKEAQDALKVDRRSLESVLDDIARFIPEGARVWSYGATSDLVWLDSACRVVGRPPIVPYYNHRCMRTLAPLMADHFLAETPHHALSDALAQTQTLLTYGKQYLE